MTLMEHAYDAAGIENNNICHMAGVDCRETSIYVICQRLTPSYPPLAYARGSVKLLSGGGSRTRFIPTPTGWAASPKGRLVSGRCPPTLSRRGKMPRLRENGWTFVCFAAAQ